ncbi:hypothetical protein [Salinibacterium sp. SWN1162]|nr:hypothetical protein [Salinibacterium sp. SWN1162]
MTAVTMKAEEATVIKAVQYAAQATRARPVRVDRIHASAIVE